MTWKRTYLKDLVPTGSDTRAMVPVALLGALLIGAGLTVAAFARGSAKKSQSRRRASFRDTYRYAARAAEPSTPVRYNPSIEQIDQDEDETIATLVSLMKGINETTFKDYGRSVRSSHAKSCGLLQGTLRVLDGLPDMLSQGMFAKPGTYPVVMRLSTQPGDMLDDSVSCPRAIALKIIGVEGERLPGSEGQVTQDFIMQNAPVFQAKDAKTFVNHLRMIAPTADTGQAWKKAFSTVMRGAEAALESVGGESGVLKALGGEPMTHLLGDTYYTQVPLLYGSYMAKVSFAPLSWELVDLIGTPLDVRGKPNGLRDAVIDFFRAHAGEWELRVQLCTDLNTMPIEDSAVRWPEDQSPYIPVARITVPPQVAWSEDRSAAVDDGMAFNAWHGLAAHRPLGSIMRARKAAYAMSATFRQTHNKQMIEEPRTAQRLPN